MARRAVIPRIETPRLLLREWRGEDREPYAAMNADLRVRRYMFPPRPLSPAESAFEIQQLVDQWRRLGFGHWAVELRESGELVGRTGIKRHFDWELDPENTEVGWLYALSAWGCGLATEGARAAVRFCLEEVGRSEVISIAHVENRASHRVMEKAGLTRAGTRRWEARGIDVVWYRRTRDEDAAEGPNGPGAGSPYPRRSSGT